MVLTGYQAVGTRGRQLLEGARDVKIHGRYMPVRAEVVSVDDFSVHSDAEETLGWLGPCTRRARHGVRRPRRARLGPGAGATGSATSSAGTPSSRRTASGCCSTDWVCPIWLGTALGVLDGTVGGMAYASDLTDEQWAVLQPVFSTPGKRGPKHAPDLRRVVDAMLYVSHTGCQ